MLHNKIYIPIQKEEEQSRADEKYCVITSS